VFFFAPAGSSPGWERTDLWDQAAALPGVRPIRDEGGRYARLFGARTSGQVLVFDPGARLVFSGGITAGRGHGGDNVGRAAVLALLAGREAGTATAPVFGCPLTEPDEEGDEG
jgi:hypothetical protein